jgi:hypothetical protein
MMKIHRNIEAVLAAGVNYQHGIRKISSLAGYPDNTSAFKTSPKSTNYSFLFGLQVRILSDKKIRPFGRVLLGFSK